MQAVCVTQGAVHALLTRVAQDCREHSSYLPQSYPAEFFFPLLTKRVAADCDCWRAACSEPANDSSCENPALPRQRVTYIRGAARRRFIHLWDWSSKHKSQQRGLSSPCSCLGPFTSPQDPLQEWETEGAQGWLFHPAATANPTRSGAKCCLAGGN